MKPLWQCFHIVLFVFQQPRPQGFSLKKGVGHPFFKGKALGTRLVFQQFTIFLFDLDFCFGNKRVKSTSLKSELLTENNGMQFTLTFPNSLQFVQKVPSVYICRLYVFTQLSARESPWVDTAHMIWNVCKSISRKGLLSLVDAHQDPFLFNRPFLAWEIWDEAVILLSGMLPLSIPRSKSRQQSPVGKVRRQLPRL